MGNITTSLTTEEQERKRRFDELIIAHTRFLINTKQYDELMHMFSILTIGIGGTTTTTKEELETELETLVSAMREIMNEN